MRFVDWMVVVMSLLVAALGSESQGKQRIQTKPQMRNDQMPTRQNEKKDRTTADISIPERVGLETPSEELARVIKTYPMFQTDFTGIGAPVVGAYPPAIARILERGMVRLKPEAFIFTSKGNYHTRTDRRGLLWIEHPFQASEKGDFGQLSATVTIPKPQSPDAAYVVLALYLNDNYHAHEAMGPYGVLYTAFMQQDVWRGYRFKQVLINDKIIWEKDIADFNPLRFTGISLQGHIVFDEPFTLSIRLFDKKSSVDESASRWHILGGANEGGRGNPRQDESRDYFHTRLFVGDAVVCTGPMDIARPDMFAPVRTFDIKPLAETERRPARMVEVTVPLEGYDRLAPTIPYPVRCGVPFSPAALPDADRLSLFNAHGEKVECQTRTLETWSDGSIQWLELQFMASRAGGESYTLRFGTDIQNEINAAMVAGEKALSEQLAPRLTLANGVPIKTIVNDPIETHCGTVCSWVKRTGRFEIKNGERFGVFSTTVRSYADAPFVLVRQQMIQSYREAMDIAAYAVTPFVESEGVFQTGPDGTAYNLNGNRLQSVMVRWFERLGPKAFVTDEGTFAVLLAAPTQPFYRPMPGEAVTHDLLIFDSDAVGLDELDALRACLEQPPRLFDCGYFLDTGALGPAKPVSADYPVDIAREGTDAAVAFNGRGLRHFGGVDMPELNPTYLETLGENRTGVNEEQAEGFYYDWVYGAAIDYLVSGCRRAFDTAEAGARLYSNRDIIHYHPDRYEAVGAARPYWRNLNHSGLEMSARNQHPAGLLLVYYLTGDDEYRAAARSMADFLADSGIVYMQAWTNSARQQATPLRSLMVAYEAFKDTKYLNAAAVLAEAAYLRIDWRRGGYTEWHENYCYTGMIPFMNNSLAESLFLYYRATGDVRAAHAIVGIAESLAIEYQPKPGWFSYSHNPRQGLYDGIQAHNMGIAATLCLAYELTGDPFFIKHARRAAMLMMEREECRRSLLLPRTLHTLYDTREMVISDPEWDTFSRVNNGNNQ